MFGFLETRRRVFAAIAVALAVALVSLGAEVNSTPTWQWVTDRPASAAVAVDDVAYLGGAFRYIGVATAAGEAFVDLTSGALTTGARPAPARRRDCDRWWWPTPLAAC